MYRLLVIQKCVGVKLFNDIYICILFHGFILFYEQISMQWHNFASWLLDNIIAQ